MFAAPFCHLHSLTFSVSVCLTVETWSLEQETNSSGSSISCSDGGASNTATQQSQSLPPHRCRNIANLSICSESNDCCKKSVDLITRRTTNTTITTTTTSAPPPSEPAISFPARSFGVRFSPAGTIALNGCQFFLFFFFLPPPSSPLTSQLPSLTQQQQSCTSQRR